MKGYFASIIYFTMSKTANIGLTKSPIHIRHKNYQIKH